MHRRTSRLAAALVAIVTGLSILSASGPATAAPAASVGAWVAAWSASPQQGDTGTPWYPLPETFQGQTVRQIVHPNAGGPAIRLRLSNVFGDQPLVVGRATVATRTTASSVDAASVRRVTFAGRAGVTVPAGRELLSDPVPYRLATGRDLAVDLYLPGKLVGTTRHADARTTSYVSTSGDHAGAAALPVGKTIASWYFLTAVEAVAPLSTGIVAFGDSITDGTGSTSDANRRWPDYLDGALSERYAVADEGISGNRLLHDLVGPSAVSRFDRDVLSKPSVRYVVILEGINDIGLPGTLDRPSENVTVAQIIGAYQQLIARANARGVKIYAGTLTPVAGSAYYTPVNEQKRDAVNAWLRSTVGKPGGFAKIVDFDALTRDPADPDRILPAYDSGDHLHPGDAGYAVMGQAAARLF